MARPEPPHAAALNATDKAGRRGGGIIAREGDNHDSLLSIAFSRKSKNSFTNLSLLMVVKLLL